MEKVNVKGMRKSMRIISENLRRFEDAELKQEKYCSNERDYNFFQHIKKIGLCGNTL